MGWNIKWLPEASGDIRELDNSVRIQVFKSILKLEIDPWNRGKPLGNQPQAALANCRAIRAASGQRIAYWVVERLQTVLILAVGPREDEQVYRNAAQRIERLRKKTGEEIAKISEMLENMGLP